MTRIEGIQAVPLLLGEARRAEVLRDELYILQSRLVIEESSQSKLLQSLQIESLGTALEGLDNIFVPPL